MSLWWLAWESNPILERYERRDLTACPASYIVPSLKAVWRKRRTWELLSGSLFSMVRENTG